MLARWLRERRARREIHRRNLEFLQRVADAVAQEYESLPFAMLSNPKRLQGHCETIVNGVWLAWNIEFHPSRSGAIRVVIDFHSDLPTPWSVKPSRAFDKAPEATVAAPERLRWVVEIPVVAFDGA
jgi:hypothetical protein